MDLAVLIAKAIEEQRFLVSSHAARRLRERFVELWQIEAGATSWVVSEVRPNDLPNPSFVCEQTLSDGAAVTVIWAWVAESDEAPVGNSVLWKLRCMANNGKNRRQTMITEWVTGGSYAVAVEVEATVFDDRPGEPFLTPQTVRFLEQVAKDAREGNIESLSRVGKVFVQLGSEGVPASGS